MADKPMMLKDFLRDDGSHSCTAAPYGFPAVVSSKSNKPPILLLRSFSKKAAATKISAIHHVAKLLHFASMKSPSVLPRSFSRKLTRRRRSKGKNDIFGDVSEVKVKVKDILRWRSFRDVVEDKSTPLDFPYSPIRCTTTTNTTTTTTTTTTTASCSKRSSWCDSDFTAEELPQWAGENKEFWVENAAALRDSKEEWSFEEYEQQSPVSVLNSPFREVEDFISISHPIIPNIQRTITKCNLRRGIQDEKNIGSEEENAAEQKARELVSYLREDYVVNDERLMVDFFMHELTINGKLHDDDDAEFDSKMLRIARRWINGELEESYEWEEEDNRESYVRDMEKGVSWNKFELEQEEVCRDLESLVLDDLIDDLFSL